MWRVARLEQNAKHSRLIIVSLNRWAQSAESKSRGIHMLHPQQQPPINKPLFSGPSMRPLVFLAVAMVVLALAFWAKTPGAADHNLPPRYGASFGPIQVLEIVD
jgi:hypothetical protein